MKPITNRDIEGEFFGASVTIPKGTPVMFVKDINGGWAIKDVDLLIDLTGNSHDPKYRYAWVKESDVEMGIRP